MLFTVFLFSMATFTINLFSVNKNSTAKTNVSKIRSKIVAGTQICEITCFSGPILSVRYECNSFSEACAAGGQICGGAFMMTNKTVNIAPARETLNLN